MRHGFPPPVLIADDVAPEAIGLGPLRPFPDVEAFPAFAAGALFTPPHAGLY
jgi:hypothetical protein